VEEKPGRVWVLTSFLSVGIKAEALALLAFDGCQRVRPEISQFLSPRRKMLGGWLTLFSAVDLNFRQIVESISQ
jgi:hypothetical protein